MSFLNRFSWFAASGLVIAAALTGCSHSGSGTASSAETTTAAVNVDSLNTGNYATKPAKPLGPAGTEAVGRRLEGARLAAVVVTPWQVDPALTDVWKKTLILRPSAMSVSLDERLPKDVWNIASDAGYVTGFVTDRRSPDPAAPKRWLQNSVWEMPDPKTASDTVAAMTAKIAEVSTSEHPRTTVTIPGHPETSASYVNLASYINKITEQPGSGIAVNALTAHGQFILYQEAVASVKPEDATALIADTLTKQIPALDKFEPTKKADLPALPRDPTGLLARTLPFSDAGSAGINDNLAWDPTTYLNFEKTPLITSKLYSETTLKWVSASMANVYQTDQNQGARQLRDAKVNELTESSAKSPDAAPKTYKPAAEVPNLPDSKCLEATYVTTNKFICWGVFDNYAFTTISPQLIDAQQQLAAQYRLLADK